MEDCWVWFMTYFVFYSPEPPDLWREERVACSNIASPAEAVITVRPLHIRRDLDLNKTNFMIH